MNAPADLARPEQISTRQPHRGVVDRRFDLLRRVLIVAYLIFLGGLVAGGVRPGQVDDLRRDVAAGRVHEAEVAGPSLPPGSTGFVDQQVRWRSGLFHRQVDVRVRSRDGDHFSGPLHGDAATWLRDHHVTVQRTGDLDSWAAMSVWKGAPFQIDGWLAGLWLAGVLAVLFLLIGGPQPWLATKWAWFWLWGTPPGVLAFLLLSGPTPPLRRPLTQRRLTGGWAFLISLVLGSAMSALVAWIGRVT